MPVVRLVNNWNFIPHSKDGFFNLSNNYALVFLPESLKGNIMLCPWLTNRPTPPGCLACHKDFVGGLSLNTYAQWTLPPPDKYTNTACDKVPQRPNICYIFIMRLDTLQMSYIFGRIYSISMYIFNWNLSPCVYLAKNPVVVYRSQFGFDQ